MIAAPVYDEGGWCTACGATRSQEHKPFCVSVRRANGAGIKCKRPGCDTIMGEGGVCSAHLSAEREARR